MFKKKEQTIEIKYHSDAVKPIDYVGDKSDWIDLKCAEDIHMNTGEFKLIPLGVSMKIPEGYEAHLAPRSSTFKKYGIIQTNSVGVIDSSYCGENDQWMFPAFASRDTDIHAGDRICQFRIMENQPHVMFKEVAFLDGNDRGGFGSTGVK